jgi:hypothetical protein
MRRKPELAHHLFPNGLSELPWRGADRQPKSGRVTELSGWPGRLPLPAETGSLLDQFHPAVFRAPILRAIRSDGSQRTGTLPNEARSRYTVFRRQNLDHRLCAAFGEIHIRSQGADVVGVPYYQQLEFGILLK